MALMYDWVMGNSTLGGTLLTLKVLQYLPDLAPLKVKMAPLWARMRKWFNFQPAHDTPLITHVRCFRFCRFPFQRFGQPKTSIE